MQTHQDKENFKDYYNTHPENTQNNRLYHKTKPIQTQQRTRPSETFAEQLLSTVYKERNKNQQIYQQIKQQFQYFHYELRPPPKSIESQSVLVKQYDSLLQERDQLQKQLTKHEYHYKAITRDKEQSFNFLIQPWRHQKHRSNENSQDKIDRMNKMMVIMKQAIDSCMQKEKEQDKQIMKTIKQDRQQYATSSKGVEKIETEISQITNGLNKKIAEQQQLIAHLTKQNQQLLQLISKMQQQRNNSHESQLQLYQKLNLLTQRLLQRQKKIEELKWNRQNSKQFISKEVDENNCPLFQIIIKNNINSKLQRKYQTIFIEKTIEEIQQFITSNKHQFIENLQVLDIDNIISDISDDDPSQGQKDNLQVMSPSPSIETENIREKKCYSSTKKPRRPRELLSALKPRYLPQNTQQIKQMVFIRRK